jgi:hypothetical protein
MKSSLIFIISIFLMISCANTEYKDEDSSGSNTNTSSASDNATTFAVTTSYGKYYLDGVSAKSIKLKKGNIYYFDLSNSSTNSHPFFIGTSSTGGNYNNEYTSGITNSRATSGTLTFIVPSNLSSSLYYNCGAHSGMGGSISIE